MTTNGARLAQLYALRAQVEALIAMDEADFQAIQQQAGCPHPEEKRRVSHNMGEEPAFFCLECKQTVKGVA